MNARVTPIQEASKRRSEARYAERLGLMRHKLHALGIELGRIQTLGDGDRVTALDKLRAQLEKVSATALMLQEESQACAEPEAAEEPEFVG